ncbi:MAG TPA: Gfo/Idh/MocA family oxidoreductase [Candidatus Baltobacteraceae bacterium]|nr:Gfo/Idh/MocA family oxidoreductase [Candidatus Baltobacteraceae bacterium]
MKTYRIGISGAGFGVKAHLPALLAHPRFDVVALASPSSAKAIAAERKIPHSYPSAAAMIEGAELDAITIASPPFTHRNDVLAALDAGLHVMCEKPFALNVEEAEEMVAASRDAGTACGIAHEFRFVPQRQALKELIDNGHLAPLREIEITHLTTFLREASTQRRRGWWFQREKGGGMANAIFCHLIDSANWAIGRPPRRTYGFLRTANRLRHDDQGEFASTVDDGCFALLDYGDGLVGRLTTDATEIVESFTFAVHGENRSAVASGPGAMDTTLYSIDADETNELQCKPSPYAKFASVLPNVPYLMELYDEFVKQIETGESALPTFQDGLETQRVLAAIGYSYPT